MKKQFMKRFLSMFLAVLMVFGSIPMDTFAIENEYPFAVMVDEEEMTEISESTVTWADWSGNTIDVPCYTVTVPQGTEEATLFFESEMQWTYYDSQGNYLGDGPTSWMADITHTVAVQDSNGDGEIDGISVQESFSTDFYIMFVYGTAECLTVRDGAPAADETKCGGLYQLAMSDVFEETEGHTVTYDYSYNSTVDYIFTKLQDGILYLTATTQSKEGEPFDLVLTASCEGGEVSHTVKLTVAPPNEGIEAQYGYDETDKSSVKVYVTLSNNGMPLLGNDFDETPIANLEIEVPYFELSLYDLEFYNRYGTEGGKGPYVNNTVVKRPTGLHLYIYLLERYYMGLPEEKCGIGYKDENGIGVLEYASTKDINYLMGEFAYNTGNNNALVYSGAATSFFMNQFWGHDCNLMYYRNHCYPYMSPGWGSTADYILLSDGDAIDIAMFSNWGFYHSGYFASFDQDCYNVETAGEALTVSTRQWGTSAAAEDFVAVNGNEGLLVTLYDMDWNELYTLDYDDADSNTITFDTPEEEGTYYLMATDPDAGNGEDAKAAPAVARIVVGEQNSNGVNVDSYYENYDFISIKDDQGRYLVDITLNEADSSFYGMIPTHQVIVEEGTEYVYLTFEAGTQFVPYFAIYDVESKFADYPSNYDELNVVENEDGTTTIEIPVADYTDTGVGIILEDDSFAWKYGFDFVVGDITEITAGTAVSRILLDTYEAHLWIDDSLTLSASVTPAEATGWTIEWTSSDDSIATVDQNGKITAVGDGITVITAAIGEVKAQCTVTCEQFNTAPSVVSGTPSWNKIKAGQVANIDVSDWFTDKEQTDLTYTAEIKKATAVNFNQGYDYSVCEGTEASVNGSEISVMIPEIGVYMLYVTANDGKMTKTHECQITVVHNDSGIFKLGDGITLSIYNVVAVDYSVTNDTEHHVVLSKHTLSRQGTTTLRKASVSAEPGYTCGQNSASENKSVLQVGSGVAMNVHVKDPNGKIVTHRINFHTECSGKHTDADRNFICDKCTMKLEMAGQFVLMAVNKNGFVIEPCYVPYATGETLKDALKASGYTFEGMDSGFITAIEGDVNEYSLYYDNGGYSLDTPAANVSAVWFTANSSQGYQEDLLNLTVQMANYVTSTNGVKNYDKAKLAYETAVREFYSTKNASKLYSDLKEAMDKYDAYMNGESIIVPITVTMGNQSIVSGKAVFQSEFDSEAVVFDDWSEGVALKPGSYQFDISDGEFRHVRGSLEVCDGVELTASLPEGKWLASLDLSIQYGENWTALEKDHVTDGSATYYVPDYSGTSLYPYAECAVDGSTHKLFEVGSTSVRTWKSKSTSLAHVIESNSLNDKKIVLEIRLMENSDSYEQYQTFTMDIQRTPSLEALTVSGDGTVLKLDFDKKVKEYTVSTTADSVAVTATALSNEAEIMIAGQVAENGVSHAIELTDAIKLEDGRYTIPVTVTAQNGQTASYVLYVVKMEAIQVVLNSPNLDASVEVFNDAGAKVEPISEEGTRYTYHVVLDTEYTYIVTENDFYHATAKFKVEGPQTINLPSPKTEEHWLNTLSLKAGNDTNKNAPVYELTPGFDTATHNYSAIVESNTAAFYLKAFANNTEDYKTETIFKAHENTQYKGREECKQIINSKYNKINQFLNTGGWGNDLLIRVTQNAVEDGVTYYQDYLVRVNRKMTLYNVGANDNNGEAMVLTQKDSATTGFEKQKFEYTTSIGTAAKHVTISLNAINTSTAYDYDQYEITVACGEFEEKVTYSEESHVMKEQVVEVPLNGTEESEVIEITAFHKGEGAAAGTYTIEVIKLPSVKTEIIADPVDATVFLAEELFGTRIYPEEDGIFYLMSGQSYQYVVTKNGYISASETFIADADHARIDVILEKAAENNLNDISVEGDWLQFRADNNNNGVVDVKTPMKAEDTVLEWSNKIGDGFDSGATGCPIIVGGYLYTYAGNSIVKVNKDTGEVVDSGLMAASSSFAINSPTYAEGMIFVGLSDGRVQAFNAETLDSLWVFTDDLGGQPNCPIVYHDGYVYTGFWNSEVSSANFVCISVTDEDPTNSTETKPAAWTYTHNGFYWAGAYVNDDFVLVGTDDGDSGYTNGYASVMTLDPKTGVLLDEERLTNVGDQRSSICYDEATDAYYFTTKGGDFYQIKVDDNGMFVKDSLYSLHLDNYSNSETNPPMSTSTPVIYNGRAYIGVSGTSQFGPYSGHNITVIDLDTFSIAYTVPTHGYPQVSGLLTTAYEEDGYVYVYFIDNYTPGKLRVIRDNPDMTEVDHTYTTTETYSNAGKTETIETGYVLFTPSGAEAQYAICSPITDADGNIYFKNDSARLMKLSSKITKLEVVQQPEKTKYQVGMSFDGTGMKVAAHYANGVIKDVTDYVSYTTEPLKAEDTEITVSMPEDGFWKWYQDSEGEAGKKYQLPTATVTIEITEEEKQEVCKVFVDVEHGAWYEDSVQYVYDEGIIVGDGNVFAPFRTTTRAMIAVILYRHAGSPEVTDYSAYNKFKDLPKVEEGIWYTDAVAWALNEGVSTGDDYNWLYNPDVPVTREQLALFLWRYTDYIGEDVTVTKTEEELFGDTFVNDWAKEGFGWAVDREIIKGAEETDCNGNIYYVLNPQGAAARAQVAVMCHRYLGGVTE